VKGTWREGSLAGDPEGYLEKALETGISFHRGSIWGTWRARLLGTESSGDGALLSQEAPWKGPQEGLLYWGTRKIRFLRDMQNALYAGLPLYRGPFWGTWRGFVCWDF